MPIQRVHFGTFSTGDSVSSFILQAGELRAVISDYGAALCSLIVPDSRGTRGDVILGPATLEGFATTKAYFGATIGRYANRIARARFHLQGREYQLTQNDGTNHLHGGRRGFDRQVWAAEAYEEDREPRLRLRLFSPDGDEGYPGALEAIALYGLSSDGSLRVTYEVRAVGTTIANLTNHAYFNLKGEGRGDILDHRLQVAASHYVPVDAEHLPIGDLRSVAGTDFDFRSPRRLREGIEKQGGYDHSFALDHRQAGLGPCAQLEDLESGRRLIVSTTLPGVHLYTGNFLSGELGKHGSVYGKHAGLCLETGYFPDSPHHPQFPSALVAAGQRVVHETHFQFSW